MELRILAADPDAHERWAAQLTARLQALGIKVVGGNHPSEPALVLIEGSGAPTMTLSSIDRARLDWPEALILVLDPLGWPGLAPSARALGADAVLTGSSPPPRVAAWLARWAKLARDRRRGVPEPPFSDPRID